AGRVNRVPYLGAGARVLAVPRSAGRAEAAFALAGELGGRSVGQQVVLEPRWGGGAVRQVHLDKEQWDAFGLEPGQARELRASLRETLQPNIRNPPLCLRVPDERAFVAALGWELRKALGNAGGE